MTRPAFIILLATLLLVVIAGCGGAHRYDSRLVLADSLMQANPDSALALVKAVDADSLSTEGDHAYRDLLLTQARYKCYITATSDSAINRALAYYRHHKGEREKLTRAYIYKGAVMQELGHPDSAMFYYKTAEATADPTDYFNLGYAKLQMCALYNNYYSFDGKDIVKYEEAIECFKLAKDSTYLLICMNNLGCLYRESKPCKAEPLLLESSILARQLKDTIRIAYNNSSLALLYVHQGRLEEARRLIQEILGLGISSLDYNTYFTAASLYAKLGMIDSAEIYLNLARHNKSGNEIIYKMNHLRCLSVLALSKNDSVASHLYKDESDRLEDSLMSNDTKFKILFAEDTHDKINKKNSQHTHERIVSSYQWIIVIAIVILLLLALRYYHRGHRYDTIISDLKKENNDRSIDLRRLQHNFDDMKINDAGLQQCVNSYMTLMREVMEACYHAPKNILGEKIKELIKFQDSNKDVWSRLYQNIDNEYNNIMSYTIRQFPQLTDKELLMIALTCMGYSCVQIAIALDYSSATSISTIRARIANKMKLDCSLNDYIVSFKTDSK